MSSRDYDYGDDFVDVKRGSYTAFSTYGSEQETERDFLPAGVRRAKRERADSIVFTPQSTFGEPTHSEAGNSAEEPAYFSTKHHQFESSFRSIRGRERAPLAMRLWDMRGAARQSMENPFNNPDEQQATNMYDSEVETRSLPAEQQELAIIEDILSLLLGVSGRYISFRYGPHSSKWRNQMPIGDALIAPMWISSTLAQMANKILLLVLMHKRIEYFTTVYARRQAGVVNQALCAAIHVVLKDYYSFVFTLETLVRTSTDTHPYTLQQLWYHLYPSMQTFERVMRLIDEIQAKDLPQAKKAPEGTTPHPEDDGYTLDVNKRSDSEAAMADDHDGNSTDGSDFEQEDEPSEQFIVRGGYTLNIISGMIKTRGGDAATRRLYEFLLSKASVPFLQMLKHWLHTGELEESKPGNPGGEFMVASDNEGSTAKTFVGSKSSDDLDLESPPTNRRLGFISIDELTPAFLRPYSVKILRTGEYLNILRACGVDLRSLDKIPDTESLSLQSAGSEFPGDSASKPSIRPGEAMSQATAELYSMQYHLQSSNQIQNEEFCSEDNIEEATLLKDWLNPQTLMRGIDQAYLRANQALLNILLKDGRMMAYMGAIKHYLLFEKSDFLTHFLDLAKFEMNRKSKDMSANRLQSFLDLALLNPASVSHDDPLKDIVRISVEYANLIDDLKVINDRRNKATGDQSMALQSMQRTPKGNSVHGSGGNAALLETSIIGDNFLTGNLFIALKLNIPFPLTIVLDNTAMNRYRAISRLILALKQTEQNLVSSWIINLKLEDPQVDAGTAGKEASKLEAMRRNVFLRIHTMRHRILISIQQILYYCFWDAIEPQWEHMIGLMKEAKTVDDLCEIHIQYVDIIFERCGLNGSKLPKILLELLNRANKFTDTVNRLASSKYALFRVSSGISSGAQSTVSGKLLAEINKSSMDPESQYSHLKSVFERLEQLDKYWAEQLKILLRALNHYAHKFDESYLNLAVRLDCNRGYGDNDDIHTGR
ncbi:Spc98 family-domain-containing protein [Coemansia spiralis]|nr:Spc98 family-domain-containing protein [Coemansia spiralis]